MRKAELRNLLMIELNVQAREAEQEHAEARTARLRCVNRKKVLVHRAKQLKLTEEERDMFPSLWYMVRDDDRDTEDEDDRLIDTARQFIEAEYEKGKYDGREAVGFFRTLFGRISEEFELQLMERMS
jgi:hypothetical protein